MVSVLVDASLLCVDVLLQLLCVMSYSFEGVSDCGHVVLVGCTLSLVLLISPIFIYTVNHKKRDILLWTITLANLNRFSQFFYHFNREEILHATIIKFSTSPDLCAHLTWKNLNLHFCRGS